MSANNKATTFRMEHVKGRKFTEKKQKEKKKNKVEEIQLANLASLGSLATNELRPKRKEILRQFLQ